LFSKVFGNFRDFHKSIGFNWVGWLAPLTPFFDKLLRSMKLLLSFVPTSLALASPSALLQPSPQLRAHGVRMVATEPPLIDDQPLTGAQRVKRVSGARCD
tara:strand:- start:3113 stop:3412 length:300 start_codon:yes stop_codon:yes gene_type:complete